MSSAMTPPHSGSAGTSSATSSRERATLQVRSLGADAQTPDEIEAEIEVQREQLAETIDALSAKLDVKSQAQAKVEGAKQTAKQTAQGGVTQVKQTARSIRPPEVIAFAVTVVVATAVLWWRER
jgi:hypothetical protein